MTAGDRSFPPGLARTWHDPFIPIWRHNWSFRGAQVLQAVLHDQLIIFQSTASTVMAATTAIPTRGSCTYARRCACDDQEEKSLRGEELLVRSAGLIIFVRSAGLIIFRWACR